jgi:hypothetical protein
MPSLRLALVPRHTFQEWSRDRHVQIAAELSALRMDLERLQRRCTQMGRCDSCKRGATVTIQDNGWWLCRRCQLTTQEVRA